MRYLYFMDYSTPAIYKIKLEDGAEKQTPDEILKDYGLDEDNGYWMFCDNDIEIETINKI